MASQKRDIFKLSHLLSCRQGGAVNPKEFERLKEDVKVLRVDSLETKKELAQTNSRSDSGAQALASRGGQATDRRGFRSTAPTNAIGQWRSPMRTDMRREPAVATKGPFETSTWPLCLTGFVRDGFIL